MPNDYFTTRNAGGTRQNFTFDNIAQANQALAGNYAPPALGRINPFAGATAAGGINPSTGRPYVPSSGNPGMVPTTDYNIPPGYTAEEWNAIPQTGPITIHGRPVPGGGTRGRVYWPATTTTDTRLSGPEYDARSRLENAQLMASQAYGGAPNYTGNTGDEGHNIFQRGSLTHGAIMPGDDTVSILPGAAFAGPAAGAGAASRRAGQPTPSAAQIQAQIQAMLRSPALRGRNAGMLTHPSAYGQQPIALGSIGTGGG